MKPKLVLAVFAVVLAASLSVNVWLLPLVFAPRQEAPPSRIELWVRVYEGVCPDGDCSKNRLVLEQPSHSFMENFLKLLQVHAGQADVTITDVGAGSDAVSVFSGTFGMCGLAANEFNGIVVGTSSAAETITDDALGARIAHGVGAGQLSYGANAVGAAASTSTTTTMTLTRSFTNTSGGSITIQEVGVYATGENTGCQNTATNNYMALRDLLSFTITNGNSDTVQYTFQTSV